MRGGTNDLNYSNFIQTLGVLIALATLVVTILIFLGV